MSELTYELEPQARSESLLRKILVVLYLAGGFFVEGKTARAIMLSISRDPQFRDFLDVTYDGRFFGLASSALEAAFCEANQRGYIIQSYNARNGEPVHLMRRLSIEGEGIVEKILKDPQKRIDLGLHEDLSSLCAEILSLNLIPGRLALAYDLYVSYVLGDARESLRESRASPNKLGRRIGKEAIDSLVSRFNTDRRFGVVAHKPEFEREDYVRIPFAIRPESIEQRYSYIVVGEEQITSFITEFEKDKSDYRAPIMLAMNGLDPSEADSRVERVAHLFKEYGMWDEFVRSVSSKMEGLARHLPEVRKKGYEHIFDILLKIAAFSQEHIDDPDSRLEAEFILSRWSTFYKARIPGQLRQELRHYLQKGVWHFGLDYHIEHVPQFLERSYLLDVDRAPYVDASVR